ncbi:IS1182 family transposase [Telmatobacter bradus]|jgi:transposase|uniref:IS1182 family transposase n=1 Tax=Telmatobacter bradus TaxID=474953 RepID=UPI003B42A2FB
MGQNFLPDTVNQTLLFPPSLHDWLPDGHLARFVVDVVSALDLESIYASYREKDGRGQSAYAPEMMVRLLLYGYATGVYSSRRLEKHTWEDVAFRYLSGDQHPDHATLAEFRKRHLAALSELFTQALLLCAKAGLVKLGHVSIDGTKIRANASKHKAMSYQRMTESEARLKQEINALLAAAEKADADEDAQYGKDRNGEELPDELQRRESRLQKIREAKQALEDEAREKAEQKLAEAEKKQADEEEDRRAGKKKRGRKSNPPDPDKAKPADKDQRNFTDPESRIMPDGANKGSFLQAYNAQIAVDSIAQVIVAAAVTQETNDKKQLLPMVAQIEKNLAQKPEKVSADTGYFSEANVTDATVAEIDLYIATGRDKHSDPTEIACGEAPSDATAREQMQHKLKTEAGRAVYKRRKAIVEPVFGQIKECRGFRRFSMRGKQNVSGEWRLVCAVSNLLKLFRSGWALQNA